MRTASSHFKPKRKACCRKSAEVSTSTVRPACSTMIETRRRLSRGSSEVQVSHSQPIDGTPVEVPVPKKVNFIAFELCALYLVLCYETRLDAGTKYKAPRSSPTSDVTACELP